MSNHYLTYWKRNNVQHHLDDRSYPIDEAAGEHHNKVKPGDILWIVTLEARDLILVGRIKAGQLLSHKQMIEQFPNRPLYPASWHVLAEDESIEPVHWINLSTSGMAWKLHFLSSTDKSQLAPSEKGIDPNQIRQLRLLTDESVQMLESLWYDKPTFEDTQFDEDYAQLEGRLVSRSRRERQRSRRAVQMAKQKFHDQHDRLYCEACGFDFSDVYGVEYIEAHHKKPISDIEEEYQVTPNDFVMLCANCHRMIHYYKPPLSLEQLRDLIRKAVRQ